MIILLAQPVLENLTLGAIGGGLVFIVGLITSRNAFKAAMKENIVDLLDDKFEAIDNKFNEVNQKMDKLEKKMDSVERGSCKNYIVPYLADMDRGATPDEIGRQRFWDAYEIYVKDGGNSYIQDRVMKLQKEGKL